MPASLKLRHTLMATAVFLPLIYQNCAPAPQEGESVSSSKSFTSTLPFAYQSKMDTIAYMSCSNIEDAVNTRAYFTFRVGAYNSATGGLSLTPEYRKATEFYTTTNRGRALADSERNNNILMSLSIRDARNLQLPFKGDAEGPAMPELDIDTFLPPLTSNEIAGALAGAGEGVQLNYFPGDASKRLIEASLRFFSSEGAMDNVRSQLGSQNALLVAGYSTSDDDTDQGLRGPEDYASDSEVGTPSKSRVYGSGYRVNFGLGGNMSSAPLRVLARGGISEIDLQSGDDVEASWNCDQTYQFMIVRPEDKSASPAKATCFTGVDAPTSAAQAQTLAAIRRVLRPEDWYVDLNRRCVVPKTTGDYCYGSTLGTRSIRYYDTSCTESNSIACPHFVSVCIRN